MTNNGSNGQQHRGSGASASASAALALAAAAAESGMEVERARGPPPEQFRVAMLGASGVGKSALTSQFLSSDHMNTYDNIGKKSQ